MSHKISQHDCNSRIGLNYPVAFSPNSPGPNVIWRRHFVRLLSRFFWFSELLPPANEVWEGYVFTGVCLSTGGVVSQHALQVSGGVPKAHTQEGSWGVWPGGVSRPTPRWGVCRPTPRGGVYPSMHWSRPPHERLLPRVVRILLEFILVLFIYALRK